MLGPPVRPSCVALLCLQTKAVTSDFRKLEGAVQAATQAAAASSEHTSSQDEQQQPQEQQRQRDHQVEGNHTSHTQGFSRDHLADDAHTFHTVRPPGQAQAPHQLLWWQQDKLAGHLLPRLHVPVGLTEEQLRDEVGPRAGACRGTSLSCMRCMCL